MCSIVFIQKMPRSTLRFQGIKLLIQISNLDVVADIISGRAMEIEYVDMRYSNGFTIGWKGGSKTPVSDPERAAQKMLAARGTD